MQILTPSKTRWLLVSAISAKAIIFSRTSEHSWAIQFNIHAPIHNKKKALKFLSKQKNTPLCPPYGFCIGGLHVKCMDNTGIFF